MISAIFATVFIAAAGVLGLVFAGVQALRVRRVDLYRQASALLNGGKGDESQAGQMIRVYEAIRNGARAFLAAEYKYMGIFIVVFGILVFLAVGSAGNCGKATVEVLPSNATIFHETSGPCWGRGALTAVAFAIGGLTSMLSGFIGMTIAVYANARTTVACRNSLTAGFNTAFNAGAVMGFALTALALLVLYATIGIFRLFLTWPGTENAPEILFEAVAGYGLGGSSIALFGRVGGGIYTKAADVGADLSGKVVRDLPEDDPRNPAVIADNVGDNVGDVAGMGADLFGSFAESTCAALVVASTIEGIRNDWTALMFPLLISAAGIIVCIVTTFFATDVPFLRVTAIPHIERNLKMQLIISTVLASGAMLGLALAVLPSEFCSKMNPVTGECEVNTTPLKAFACVLMGLWSGLIIGLFTEYYTSHSYSPVREISEASQQGAAINIILGLALGYLSTIIPTICLAGTIFGALKLADMYGVALAALGILSTLSVGLTIDAYGPISDNAGGIAEMCGLSDVRVRTDALDAAGNTTAAVGKGFAIGSAALVSLALFGAFVTRTNITAVNILKPIAFAGLLYGSMLPYWFSALTMKAVGIAANDMVKEVDRQFRSNPRILTGEDLPDVERCVKISTDASLRMMVAPGALVMISPIAVGFIFGKTAVTGLLAGGLVSGVQLAISASNTGGAWDNAKKYVEERRAAQKEELRELSSQMGINFDDVPNALEGEFAVALEEPPEGMPEVNINADKQASMEVAGGDEEEGDEEAARVLYFRRRVYEKLVIDEAKKAAVTGDTVGDPLKDTSGPSLNILMKLMAIISLVFSPLFTQHSLNLGE